MAYAGPYSKLHSEMQETSINTGLLVLTESHTPILNKYMNLNPEGTSSDPLIKDVKHYWTHKKMKGLNDILKSAITSTSATTIYGTEQYTFYLDNSTASKTIIRIDDELMYVSNAAWDSGNSRWTLTVTRGYNSTTAATHLAGADITIVSTLTAEGADVDRSDIEVALKDYNYTQIIRRELAMSKTQQAIKTYVNENSLDVQALEKFPFMLKELENVMINGVRMLSGTNNELRMMGGMNDFIKSDMKFDLAGNAVTPNTFDDIMYKLARNGVDINNGKICIQMGQKVRQQMSAIKAKIIRDTNKINGLDYTLERLILPTGYELIVDPICHTIKNNEFYIYPEDSISVKFLRAYERIKIGATGSNDKEMLEMEGTIEFKGWALGGAAKGKNAA